jgi:hypothetical protein
MDIRFNDLAGSVTITPTRDERKALGPDFALLADQFATLLLCLAQLRGSNRWSLSRETIELGLNDVVRKLQTAVDGVGAALVREHHDVHLPLTHLADTLGVPLSTAQYRRDKVLKNNPSSDAEAWATPSGTRYAQPPQPEPERPRELVASSEVPDLIDTVLLRTMDQNPRLGDIARALVEAADPKAIRIDLLTEILTTKNMFHRPDRTWRRGFDLLPDQVDTVILQQITGGTFVSQNVDGVASLYRSTQE